MSQQRMVVTSLRMILKWMPPQRMVVTRTILTSRLPQRKAVMNMILKSMPVPPRRMVSMMMIPMSMPAKGMVSFLQRDMWGEVMIVDAMTSMVHWQSILKLMPQQRIVATSLRVILKWMPPQRMVVTGTIPMTRLPQRKAEMNMILKSMPVPPRKIISMMMIPKSTRAHWQRMISTRMRTIEKSTLLRKKKRYGHHV